MAPESNFQLQPVPTSTRQLHSLEGFARPLWAIGALLASKKPSDPIDPRLEGWIRGFSVGADPSDGNEEYWGDVADKDQRMVEIEILAYALLADPSAFLGMHDAVNVEDVKRRGNITRYLQSVNGKEFPLNNWLWFRVMANLALVQSCGVPYEELKESMNADLEALDSFYIGNGWASDGPWDIDGSGGRQMDYYSGSFAIQFSQLMYVRYAGDLDLKRCEVYKQRARDFAVHFWRYFNDEGAAIPFGRSLTYRFAMGGFWAAVAMAEVDLPAPLTPGVVKGLLLRHLRHWADKHDIFYPDGTLNIGFHYPNMYMSEDYNSPQSPYWCMKTFCLLALPESHRFWQVKEERHPLHLNHALGISNVEIDLFKEPRHILVDSGNHHFLLSGGQYCGWPIKAAHAKYSKFAYSSSFAFSVPTGPLIEQLAPDSTLALSEDGCESWKMRLKSEETIFGLMKVKARDEQVSNKPYEDEIQTMTSRWEASKNVSVQTTLIPPSKRWPDWHIRIHRLTLSPSFSGPLHICEGAFATFGQSMAKPTEPRSLILFPLGSPCAELMATKLEGIHEDASSALIVSSKGASGIVHLGINGKEYAEYINGHVLKPDSNTNLIEPRTLIPTVVQTLSELDFEAIGGKAVVWGTAIFAIVGQKIDNRGVIQRWEDKPKLVLDKNNEIVLV